MKSVARFSALVAFAALLCFAPYAFSQGPDNVRVAGAGNSVRNYAPSGFLTFALSLGGNPKGGNPVNGGRNGCGNQGGRGGWFGEGWFGGGGGGGCAPVPVPEGGTALMYLLLAGLCCVGAMILRSRRPAGVRETN
jgi:hypothetical protein